MFFRYAFLSDISYKERGYPCEYLQYIYAQSIRRFLIIILRLRSQEGNNGVRMNKDKQQTLPLGEPQPKQVFHVHMQLFKGKH